MPRAVSRTHERRRRVYEILERGDPGDAVSVAIYRSIVALIVQSHGRCLGNGSRI